ncbi:MAG: response regulator [Sideroxydans sp.]|nr:response regulator [Sideroxydans sp.]
MPRVRAFSLKILLVEDNRLSAEAMQMVLENDGYSVYAADSARHALRALNNFIPGLVITDIVMPDMDGLEFIGAIRGLLPNVPILAVSGMGDDGGDLYLKQAQKLGADMTLMKPVKREVLLDNVNALMSVR